LRCKGEEFAVPSPYWAEHPNEDGLTTDDDAEYTLKLLHNLYRAKHRIPHPEDLEAERLKYGLTANKMAAILGISPNAYRNYEAGEIPSLSNAKLLGLIDKPLVFRELVVGSEELKEKEKNHLIKQITNSPQVSDSAAPYHSSFGHIGGNMETGLREPNDEKAIALTAYITHKARSGKVKMNKLLFYCDQYHFKKHARSITGSRYRAVSHGPIHAHYEALFYEAQNQEAIVIENEQIKDEYIQHTLSPKWTLEKCKQYLSATEIESIDVVLSKLGSMRASELEYLSHQEECWKQQFSERQLISYETAPILYGV
jgi:uncharacterized phage-associated protein/transcriptional regulator with XRE-family HTH domain